MANHGDGGGDNIKKSNPIERELRTDLVDFRSAERSHNPGDVQSSGHRLQEAATAYENTLQKTPDVMKMAEEIKKGTPGTPEWDELMTRVEKQLNSNVQQFGSIQARTAEIPGAIAAVQTTDKHLPNPIINMNA